jgi:hypothetical protein
MRDRERRERLWTVIEEKKRAIDELRGQVRSQGLNRLLDSAFGNLEFSRQVLGTSIEVYEYPGAEDDERRLFDAVELFILIASNQVERVRKVLQEYGPDAHAF